MYDYAWAPFMRSDEPASCVFAATSRDHPVHLWDAYNGTLRATYQCHDQYDAVAAAHSLAFADAGGTLLCGRKGALHVHSLERPGRAQAVRSVATSPGGVRGVVSRVAVHEESGMIACGGFCGRVALYGPLSEGRAGHERQQHLADLPRLPSGVTDLRFSPDGRFLWVGMRRRGDLYCFDVRSPQRPVMMLDRGPLTNQRMYFDLTADGRWLATGTQRGEVRFYDTWSAQEAGEGLTVGPAVRNAEVVLAPPVTGVADPAYVLAKPPLSRQLCGTSINGVSLHPYLPLAATSTGQRHFAMPGLEDDSDAEGEGEGVEPMPVTAETLPLSALANGVGLWSLKDANIWAAG
jgi:WD40 repeat protein